MNWIRTALTLANIVLAAMLAGLMATGCTKLANGDLDCAKSILSPATTGYLLIAVNVLKLAIRVPVDGLGGLLKGTSSVSK